MPNTSAESKARQRARNKAAGMVGQGGSSGIHELLRQVPEQTFEEAKTLGLDWLGAMRVMVPTYQLIRNNTFQLNGLAPTGEGATVALLAQASQFGFVWADLWVPRSLREMLDGSAPAAG